MGTSFTDSLPLQQNFLENGNTKATGSSPTCDAAKEIWERFLNLLAQNLKPTEIKTWFSVLAPKSFENNTLVIRVPSKDYYGMIEKRYNKQISSIIESGLLGENGKLSYEVAQESLFDSLKISADGDIGQEPGSEKTNLLEFRYPYGNNKPQNSFPAADSYPHRILIKQDSENFSSNLFPKHTFDNFISGDSNDLAVAVAYSIANKPGHSNNPFLVYGGVGLGKTHLVQAIGNEVLKRFPEKRVYYSTTPDFTTQFTTNMARNKIDFSGDKDGIKKLDSFYKSLDVLILDDIQNLEGKPGTQDFMYQIFNTLYNNKKHIIFSSDKPINQLKSIEERLISRFQCGMTVDIQAPSWEMRVAIIQKKLNDENVDISEDVIHFIASNVKDSIRTIEGCLIGIIAESTFNNKGIITLEVAERVVQRVIGTVKKSRSVSIENIILAVSDYFKISENQILSRKRTKEIAFARQVAMYLAKEMTNYTLESIGLNFGGKDHATVLYAHNLIRNNLKKDKELYNIISDVKEAIARF